MSTWKVCPLVVSTLIFSRCLGANGEAADIAVGSRRSEISRGSIRRAERPCTTVPVPQADDVANHEHDGGGPGEGTWSAVDIEPALLVLLDDDRPQPPQVVHPLDQPVVLVGGHHGVCPGVQVPLPAASVLPEELAEPTVPSRW